MMEGDRETLRSERVQRRGITVARIDREIDGEKRDRCGADGLADILGRADDRRRRGDREMKCCQAFTERTIGRVLSA